MPLLTEEEVRHYLDVSHQDLQELVKRGRLTAFRLGGTYVRFRKEEVLAIKSGRKFVAPEEIGRTRLDQFRDFWKFYSFYILSTILILLLVIFFVQL
ncbi:MAG: helix-turn-helix domain-containing protein [Candidatus Omnitrophica bacterium]|nr:helix-turn-helix domain-containing protein [Candidatus Omnitrophota bacterium]